MYKGNLLFSLVITTGIISGFNAQAQFSGLIQKAKDKAAQKMSDAMDKKKTSSSGNPVEKNNKLTINSGFDFIAGDTILFSENFSSIPVGASAHMFKTNGSASIVSVNNENSKWLVLADNATYKFAKQLFYPKHFTVEFDILTSADEVKDIYPLIFGFINENSVKEYNSGTGAYISLLYFNNNEVNVNSSFIDKYFSTKFDLTTYANRKMHVSINVEGDRMAVYLEKTKIADTQVFLPDTAKNFYISGPNQYRNGAKVMVSNFKIMGFKEV